MPLTTSELLSKSWDSIKGQLPLVAGLTLVFFIGIAAFTMVPFIGSFLGGPFTAGYLRSLIKIRDKQEIGYEDIFWGFTNFNRFLQFVVLGLITGLLALLGTLFFIIPGIWFWVAASLSSAFLVLDGGDAVAALKKSMATVKGHWFHYFGLALTVMLLTMAGIICFVLGVLITTPLAMMALVIAAETQNRRPQDPAFITPVGDSTTPSVMTVNPS